MVEDCKSPTPLKKKKRVRFVIDDPEPKKSKAALSFLERLVRFRKLSSHNVFLGDYGLIEPHNEQSQSICRRIKASFQYGPVLHMEQAERREHSGQPSASSPTAQLSQADAAREAAPPLGRQRPSQPNETKQTAGPTASVAGGTEKSDEGMRKLIPAEFVKSAEQVAYEQRKRVFPEWHPPWLLKRVISGHYGWVRAVAIDVSNDWFITGSNDRTIKIWDLASGVLKLTLTGHTTAVRGLCVSGRHPYIFSCGDDKTVRCWDFEQNKVIRKYHGHLSGVYDLSLHPSLDVLVSVGRDSSARVWDVRTKAQIFVLSGHKSTVACVATQEYEPQVITGSHDHTVRLWDLRNGSTLSTLTHHKKSIRDLALHFQENTFITAAADAIKVWKCPKGDYLRNLSPSETIINTVRINKNNVLVSGGDEGTLKFWDYKTGYNFQTIKAPPQPGSLGLFSPLSFAIFLNRHLWP